MVIRAYVPDSVGQGESLAADELVLPIDAITSCIIDFLASTNSFAVIHLAILQSDHVTVVNS